MPRKVGRGKDRGAGLLEQGNQSYRVYGGWIG